MSNMSYCRFQNTLSDFQDCLDAVLEADSIQDMNLSPEELRALKRLTTLAERFSSYAEDLLTENENEE